MRCASKYRNSRVRPISKGSCGPNSIPTRRTAGTAPEPKSNIRRKTKRSFVILSDIRNPQSNRRRRRISKGRPTKSRRKTTEAPEGTEASPTDTTTTSWCAPLPATSTKSPTNSVTSTPRASPIRLPRLTVSTSVRPATYRTRKSYGRNSYRPDLKTASHSFRSASKPSFPNPLRPYAAKRVFFTSSP